MKIFELKIANFSRTPFGRYKSDGDYSAEIFRDEHLIPALKSYDLVNLDLDGVMGYGSSFLSEVFSPLKKYGFSEEKLLNKLNIISSKNHYKDEIKDYIKDA